MMNIPKKTSVLIGFVSVFVCFTAWALFQSLNSNPVIAQSQTQLTFEISTPQQKYLQREPIELHFKLSNQITVPITWNGLLNLGSDMNMKTRSDSGSEFRWIGNRGMDDPIMLTEVMQPGKNAENQSLIDENLFEKLFPRPGRYELRAEFIYRNYTYGQKQVDTIVSNPIIIEIEEPKGKDRKAFDYLKNEYASAEKSNDIKEKMRVHQYFVDNFPDSVYWKYKTYKLGVSYLMTGENEKAEREFLKISEIDFYHSEKVDKHFDTLITKLGRDKRNPERWHGRVVTNAPGAPVLRAIPVPSISPIPLPNNPPVLIRIPNPTPFPTPNLTP